MKLCVLQCTAGTCKGCSLTDFRGCCRACGRSWAQHTHMPARLWDLPEQKQVPLGMEAQFAEVKDI